MTRKILLASASILALFPPRHVQFNVNGVQHQELHVDGGASMQTFLYPARSNITKKAGLSVCHEGHRLHYRQRAIGGGVERSTLSIANRAVATHTTDSGVSDLYRMYGLAKPDGVGFLLAFIAPPSEFDRSYTSELFEYAPAKARAGYPWLNAPPCF